MIKHLAVILYILALTSGVAAAGVFGFLYLRGRSRLVRKYLLFLFAYTLLLGLLAAGVYAFVNLDIAADGGLVQSVFISIVLPCAGLLMYTVPDFYQEYAGIALAGKRKMVIAVMASLSLVFLALYWLFIESPLAVAVSLAYPVLYTGVSVYYVTWLFRHSGTPRAVSYPRAAVPVIALYLGLSILLSAVETALQFLVFKNPGAPGVLFTLPLFYLAWNVLSLVFAYQVYFRNDMGGKGPLVSAEFTDRYGITPKEKGVVELLLQGMSNRQIALELEISQNTVRNHIYSVYQKTGCDSRVELVNAVSKRS